MFLSAHCWVKISLPQKYTDVKAMYFYFLELPWTKQVRRLARSSLGWNIFLFFVFSGVAIQTQDILIDSRANWHKRELPRVYWQKIFNLENMYGGKIHSTLSSLLRLLFDFLWIHWLMYKVFAAVVKFELLYSTRMWNDSSPSN